jgi:hypothetical protein
MDFLKSATIMGELPNLRCLRVLRTRRHLKFGYLHLKNLQMEKS